jgi:hypothetical protein
VEERDGRGEILLKNPSEILEPYIKERLKNVPKLLAETIGNYNWETGETIEEVNLDYRFNLKKTGDRHFTKVTLTVSQLVGVPKHQPTYSDLIKEVLINTLTKNGD